MQIQEWERYTYSVAEMSQNKALIQSPLVQPNSTESSVMSGHG